MYIDFWYGNKMEDITHVDATFYPNEGIYKGNLYKCKETIGDYSCENYSEIERTFPGIFN